MNTASRSRSMVFLISMEPGVLNWYFMAFMTSRPGRLKVPPDYQV